MATDTERLDWLNEQGGAALVNDDAGRWAIAFDGIQNVVDHDGPFDVETSFFIVKDRWRTSVREAIDIAMTEAT